MKGIRIAMGVVHVVAGAAMIAFGVLHLVETLLGDEI